MPNPETRHGLAVHDWAIEEREYRRQEARRGRRHAYDHLDPRRTALVVIDLVPFFVEDSAYCRGIVPAVNAIATELRDAGGVVAWVAPGYRAPSVKDREFLGDHIAEMFTRSGGVGSPRDGLWPGLEVEPEDLAIEKTYDSAYYPGSSDLPDLLAERGVDTLLATGTVTNVGSPD